MPSATTAKRAYAPRLPPEQRREQLLDAVLDIALERGFHAVTVDGVARACRVTRPVVYGLFADRDALLTGLFERSERRVLAQLAQVFPALPEPDDDIDPDALLVDGLDAYLRSVCSDPRTWRVVLLPPEGAPTEVAARVQSQRRVMFSTLRDLLEWGLPRRGGPTLDRDLFARAVFTLAEGSARMLLEQPDQRCVQEFTDFARSALKAMTGPTVSPVTPNSPRES